MVDFYNWNRVKVRYCDGSSFTGDVQAVNPVSIKKKTLRFFFFKKCCKRKSQNLPYSIIINGDLIRLLIFTSEVLEFG